MTITTFGVIGSGQMGNGIAQVAATGGLSVVMNDIKLEFAEKGLAAIKKNLNRLVEKGKMSEEQRQAIVSRIRITGSLEEMAGATAPAWVWSRVNTRKQCSERES